MKHMIQVITHMVVIFAASTTMAAPFSFSVDSFTVVGNQGGIVVDEFNDENIAPFWEVYDPNVVESNETLTFSNSGVQAGPIQFGSLNLLSEWSYVGSMSEQLQIINGAGNFIGSTVWEPVLPDINQMYSMGVDNEPSDNSIGIAVYNFDQVLADAFGIEQGIGVFFGRFGDISTSDIDVQSFSIIPNDITGDIHLALGFIDSTDTYFAGFSLDGGGTYQDPFTGITSGSNGDRLHWSLGAESIEVVSVPEPSTFWLLCTAIFTLLIMNKPKTNLCLYNFCNSLFKRNSALHIL